MSRNKEKNIKQYSSQTPEEQRAQREMIYSNLGCCGLSDYEEDIFQHLESTKRAKSHVLYDNYFGHNQNSEEHDEDRKRDLGKDYDAKKHNRNDSDGDEE